MYEDDAAGVSEEQLAEILSSLPGDLADLGVAISPTMFVGMRSPDFVFAHPLTTVVEFVAHLALIQPRVVFVDESVFDAATFATSEDGEISEDLLATARERDGQHYGLMVTWADSGVISSWSMSTAWYEALTTEAETQREVAEGMDQLEREQHRAQNRIDVERRLGLVMADASFRAASPAKRTTQALLVLERSDEDVSESWMIATWFKRTLLSAARLESAAGEERLLERLAEAASALAQDPKWSVLTTKAKGRAAAREFALSYTDGWAPGDAIVDRLSDAATDRARR